MSHSVSGLDLQWISVLHSQTGMSTTVHDRTADEGNASISLPVKYISFSLVGGSLIRVYRVFNYQ